MPELVNCFCKNQNIKTGSIVIRFITIMAFCGSKGNLDLENQRLSNMPWRMHERHQGQPSSLFFPSARGGDLERSTVGMYRSLLYQVLQAFPDLSIHLEGLSSAIQQHAENYQREKDELQDLFSTMIQKLGQRRLICFIEALDECEENQIRELVGFLEQMGRLSILSQTHFHVCLSSRHYPYVSIERSIQLILEDEDEQEHDISKYLNSTLKAGRGKQADQIRSEILKRSCGIFLWGFLVVQILNKEYDHGRVHTLRKRLREIPDGLEKLFEDILTRDQENVEELTLCLQWILYASRPLKREELYCATVYGDKPETIAPLDHEEATSLVMERFILSCSKGLVEITKSKTQVVQFIHESVREFFLGRLGSNQKKVELGSVQSHDRLKDCYLNHIALVTAQHVLFPSGLPIANSEIARDLRVSILDAFPFLEYAVRNVLHHANAVGGLGLPQKAFVEKFPLRQWILVGQCH